MSHDLSGKRDHTAGIVLELQLQAWHHHPSIRIVPHGGENAKHSGMDKWSRWWVVSQLEMMERVLNTVKKRNLNCGENTDRKTNAVSPECEEWLDPRTATE
jgi:hypothetical protein